jgi:membrane associated rhomboid family serine protease
LARRGQRLDAFTFGGRLPWAVGLVLAITVVLSLFAAFGSRHAAPLFDWAALCPGDVWHGQLWRLVTWPWIEPSPLGLIFACLFLLWFGRDLAEELGSPRFLAVFGGVLLAAGVCTCLVALIDPSVLEQQYLGGWALADAMIVAWGLWFPHRVVRFYFVLPIRGFWLAWLTVAITVVLAVYMGWESVLPDLCAEGAILAWIYRGAVVTRWARMRRSVGEARRRDARRRQRSAARAKGVAHLRLVESSDDDPPPLPPEVQDRVDALLGGPKRGSD